MHIILGLLTTIVTALYVLDRMGIDLGGLNPFYWRRRRAWAAKYQGDPIYSIEDPMQIAAILVVGVAKTEGDVSTEHKQAALSQFESVFSLAQKDANELYLSTAHLLGAPQVIDKQLDGVARKNAQRFSTSQVTSLLDMMRHVANIGEAPTQSQVDIIENISQVLQQDKKPANDWTQD